jgi:pimeloyl-ACP methyl ester carboxylesterase
MPTSTATRTEHDLAVGGLRIHAKEKGDGPPLVMLHHSTGPLWTPFYDKLAEASTLIAIDLPGYGRSERSDLLRSPRDLAVLALQAIGVLDRGPVHLVGLGMGGWVAAEMASMNQELLSTVTLVGAAGIKPEVGMIHDPMMQGYIEYNRLGFASEERYDEVYGSESDPELIKLWDFSREMTARITWKPWMWSTSLPAMVRGIRLPTLLIWGEHDLIVPLECGFLYNELIEGSTLQIVPGVGHIIDMEDPDELAGRISEFVNSRKA